MPLPGTTRTHGAPLLPQAVHMRNNPAVNNEVISALTPRPLVEDEAVTDAISADEFKLAFRGLAAGVAFVTAKVDGELAAMTATSVASLSATPPLFVFSASQLSSATKVIERAETLVVHILSADQIDLAKLGATSGVDRFADTDRWGLLPTGEPHFPEAHVFGYVDVLSIVSQPGPPLCISSRLCRRTRRMLPMTPRWRFRSSTTTGRGTRSVALPQSEARRSRI